MKKKIKKGLIIVSTIVLLIAFAFYIDRWMAIDRCLDLGGRWNYETGTCEPSLENLIEREMAIDRCLDLGGRWNYEKGICEYQETEIGK